jgi:hypothetical protein
MRGGVQFSIFVGIVSHNSLDYRLEALGSCAVSSRYIEAWALPAESADLGAGVLVTWLDASFDFV